MCLIEQVVIPFQLGYPETHISGLFGAKQFTWTTQFQILFCDNKAVIGYEQQLLDQKITEIPRHFKEQYEVIKSRAVLLEFMPKGVTKAYGLALLAKDLGLTAAEIMTIGDEENDLRMIEYAGIGVAMANAVDQVKAVANVVTASNEEDGVAQVIEKYLLK